MKAGRLAVANHRGVMVPRTLGLWLAGAALVSSAAVAAFGDTSVSRAGWGALAATMLVFAAGLIDDLVPDGPRGIREHVGALASGHVSTGIVKVLVIVASSVVAVALQPERSGWIRLAGVVLVAACANAWNGLDVRPGRAIKFALLAMLGLVSVDLAVAADPARAWRPRPSWPSGRTCESGRCSATGERTCSGSRSAWVCTWCWATRGWSSPPRSRS